MPRPRSVSDDAILDAAYRVLLVRGPHAFTLADVAEEVGLSPATLLQRFGSKRNILVAFGRRAAASATASFEAATRAERSPVRALRRALRDLPTGVWSRAEMASALEMLLEDVRDDELRAAAADHARRTEAAIQELVAAAMKAGELAAGDPHRLAATLFAAYNGALVQWALRGEGSLADWIDATVAPLLARPARRR